MENKFEQILKDYPQRLAQQIEKSIDYQRALVFASERKKKGNDLSIKRLEISNVEIKISFSLQDEQPTVSTNYKICIPVENHNI